VEQRRCDRPDVYGKLQPVLQKQISEMEGGRKGDSMIRTRNVRSVEKYALGSIPTSMPMRLPGGRARGATCASICDRLPSHRLAFVPSASTSSLACAQIPMRGSSDWRYVGGGRISGLTTRVGDG
jgi:hypothetical protein